MAVYMLSYDLRIPGRKYETLYDSLRKLGAVPALESVWFLENPYTATQIRDTLMTLLDKNDGLAVIEIHKDAAWAATGMIGQSTAWMKQRRP